MALELPPTVRAPLAHHAVAVRSRAPRGLPWAPALVATMALRPKPRRAWLRRLATKTGGDSYKIDA